jgi:hypothetical protein
MIVVQNDLEEKIKDLCNRAIKAEGAEFQKVLTLLQEALREQSARARGMVADQKRRVSPSE